MIVTPRQLIPTFPPEVLSASTTTDPSPRTPVAPLAEATSMEARDQMLLPLESDEDGEHLIRHHQPSMDTDPFPFAPVRERQLGRFSHSLVLLAALYIGILLGLSEYTSYDTDPQGQINQYYQVNGYDRCFTTTILILYISS